MKAPAIAQAHASFGVNYEVGYDGFILRHKDAVSAGIRWFEQGWDKFSDSVVPSHAFKILGPDATIEAFAGGVKYGSLASYIEDPTVAVFVRKPVFWNAAMGDAFRADATVEVGLKKGYNFWLIAAMAVGRSRLGALVDLVAGKNWFSTWLDKIADSKRAAICSQEAAILNNKRPELQGRGCLGISPDQSSVTPLMLFQEEAVYEPGAVELLP